MLVQANTLPRRDDGTDQTKTRLTDRWHIDTGTRQQRWMKPSRTRKSMPMRSAWRAEWKLKDLANQLCAARDSENQRDWRAVIAAIYRSAIRRATMISRQNRPPRA